MFDDAIADRATIARLQNDFVADFEVAQHGELRVAMRGDHAVADRLRSSGSVDMPGTERHRASTRARKHNVALALAAKFNLRDRPGVGPSPRLHALFAVERSRPRSLE